MSLRSDILFDALVLVLAVLAGNRMLWALPLAIGGDYNDE